MLYNHHFKMQDLINGAIVVLIFVVFSSVISAIFTEIIYIRKSQITAQTAGEGQSVLGQAGTIYGNIPAVLPSAAAVNMENEAADTQAASVQLPAGNGQPGGSGQPGRSGQPDGNGQQGGSTQPASGSNMQPVQSSQTAVSPPEAAVISGEGSRLPTDGASPPDMEEKPADTGFAASEDEEEGQPDTNDGGASAPDVQEQQRQGRG